MTETSRRKAILPALLLLFVAVFLAHGRALQGDFLNFDDDRMVSANPLFQAPPSEALLGIFDPTRTIADAYLPVSHFSLFLDWKLFGGMAWGLHLSSLLWHFLAAAALFVLGLELGLSRSGALLGALLFAVHPALVEDVAWISSRKYLLAGLFSFLCLAFWISALEGRRRARFWVVPTALLAVYSNGAALVLLPWVILLSLFHAWIVPEREGRPSFPWGTLALLFAVTAGAALHHGWIASRAGTAGLSAGSDRSLAMVPAVFGWYLEKAVYPAGLSVDYPYTVYLKKLSSAGAVPWILVGGALLAAVLLLAGARRRRGRRDAFLLGLSGLGILVFFAGLLPFNDFLPASSILLADRYLYLPVAGLALALGATASGRWRLSPFWKGLPLAGILLFLPWSFLRTGDFRDSETLWRATMAAEPASALAPFNLATEILSKGGLDAVRGARGEEVRKLLERALERARRPQLRARILRQEAVFYAWRGAPEKSALLLERACGELERLPWKEPVKTTWALYTLERARRLREAGRKKEAWKLVEEVEKRLPGWVDVRIFKASLLVERIEALQKEGKKDAAAREARKARPFLEKLAAAHPRNYEALRALARLEATRLDGGRFTRAMKLLHKAQTLEPNRPQAYLETANIYLAMDPPAVASAIRELDRGLARIPGNPDLLALKGMIFFQKGRFDQGVAFLEDAYKRAPQRADLRSTLLQALCTAVEESLQKKGGDPGKWLEKAQALDRGNPEVLRVTGVYLAAGGKLREAVEVLEKALARGARPGPTRKALAATYRKMGYLLLPTRRNLALQAFRRSLEFTAQGEPVGSIPEILQGEIRKLREASSRARLQGKEEEARRLLQRARSLADPARMPETWALLSLDRVRLGLEDPSGKARALERARKVLCRDLGCSPEDLARGGPVLLEGKVRSWLTAGRSGKALQVLELMERVLPPSPRVLALKAEVLLARGEIGPCRKVLEEGLKLWPSYRRLQVVQGKVLCLEGLAEWKKVRSPKALEKVLRGASLCGAGKVPPEADALLRDQAARVLEQAEDARARKDWKKALALLERGIGYLPPGVPEEVRWQAVLEKGLCLARMDRPWKALRVLEALDLEARAEKKAFLPAVRARAALLAALGRTGEARKVLRSWLEAFPGAPGRKALEELLGRFSPASRPGKGK